MANMGILSAEKVISDNFESLSPSLDQAFHELFSEAISNNLDITIIDRKLLPCLETIGFEYLRMHSDFETTKKYLKNLRILWLFLAQKGNLEGAKWYLQRILEKILEFEKRSGIHIHKGSIYYFWGGTSLLLEQIDEGFLLMHTAYDEELKIQEPQPTPSLKFVSLDFTDQKHLFFPLVKMYADYFNSFLIPYRLVKISSIQLDDIRKSFMESNPNPDIVFSFTHTFAKLYQLSHYHPYTLHSDFSGQYELNLLFDLVLVIENALRAKYIKTFSKKIYFPVLAESLSLALSWHMKSSHFTKLIQHEAEKDFDQTILKLLDKAFPFTHGIVNLELESNLAIAYLIRNRGAHDLTSSKAITFRFKDVLQSLLNVLFLTVEVKYM